MSTIPLRDYCQKIESLIDIGNNDEAIFHSLTLLNSYPKYTSAYRFLGNALLEEKRFQEAFDIFSKVLAVFPDDFISHVGLSAIKENELDLEKAIWHMEQAFDAQPSNVVVQEELRRLLGRRDGVSPNKIRLSRGALIRMYLKGELYQQAISEIHAFQKNELDKVDLDAILAKIYALTGRLDEAVEISRKILGQYPYNFESNKILSIHGDLAEKNTHRSRLIEIDPYFQFVCEQYQTPEEVPADSILVEEESYSPPDQEKEAIPDWARQIGLTWLEEPASIQSDEPGFDWSEERVSPFTAEPLIESHNELTQEQSVPQEDALPGWMKSAGWTKETDSINGLFDKLEEKEPSEPPSPPFEQEEAEPVDSLPDWMKEIHVADDEVSPINESAHDGIRLHQGADPENPTLDWATLDTSQPGASEPLMPGLFEESSPEPETQAQPVDLPDWLKNYDVEVPESETSYPEHEVFPTLEPSTIGEEFFPEIDGVGTESDNTTKEENIDVDFIPPVYIDSVPDTQTEPGVPSPVSSEENVPDWVQKILGGSSITSALQEGVIPTQSAVAQEDEMAFEGTPIGELDFVQEQEDNRQSEQDLDIPEFITDLPTESEQQGLTSNETNEELISWLDEVTAEELLPSDIPATMTVEEGGNFPNLTIESPTAELSVESLTDPNNDELTGEQVSEQSGFSGDFEELPDIDDRLSGLLDESENNPLIDQWLNSSEEKETHDETITDAATTDLPLEDSVSEVNIQTAESRADSLSEVATDTIIEPSLIQVEEPSDSQNQKLDQAALLIDQLIVEIETEPNSSKKWRELGDAYFQSDRIDDALAAYSRSESILITGSQE